jgi:two-component system chemotaxis response regulator CheY
MNATAAGPRVLVVDDAATVRLYHGQVLASAGFEVVEAANGLEAVERAQWSAFDLYLIDVNMPKMDGYACVAALRGEAVGTDAPIIVISNEEAAHDAARAYAAGANLYLVKPVEPGRLTTVARMLTESPATRTSDSGHWDPPRRAGAPRRRATAHPTSSPE